jgi:hypothetical protein
MGALLEPPVHAGKLDAHAAGWLKLIHSVPFGDLQGRTEQHA